MRFLVVVLILTVAVGVGFVVLAATDSIPFLPPEDEEGSQSASVDRFDADAAFAFLERQVELGPRPAGSEASRELAGWLRDLLPSGRYQSVPGGLRNVLGEVPGRDPERFVVVGAHYDTKDIPGFVGANDGASGTAVVAQLARAIEPRELEPTVVFALFDGEESPRGTPDEEFAEEGLRGSKVAARSLDGAEAMINVDFVGDERLSLPREANSDPALWERLRAAAERVGYGDVYPPGTAGAVLDDHIPFRALGVPAIDLIDFDFDCFHKPCDDLSAVAPESLDAAGEPLVELLRDLGDAR
jgi:glutaminyl-peptide cyclotransferase